MIEYSQFAALFVSITTAIIIGTDNKLIKRFRKENATTPEKLINFSRSNRFIKWRLARFQTEGALRKAGSDSYYFDELCYTTLRKNRKKRVIFLLPILFIILIIIYLFDK
ncbi:MAG: hypothetical protein ACE5G1_02665 [bacterium]